jgi:sugar/nucleoside kinase (ribokinase family)
MQKQHKHIFIYANLVDDIINGKHYLGGEGGYLACTIQILNEVYNESVPYTLGGQIGNDSSGLFLINYLQSLNVNTLGLRISKTNTCQAITKRVRRAEFIGFQGGPVCLFTERETNKFYNELLSNGWLFFSSNTLYDDLTWTQVCKTVSNSPRLNFFDINWREALLKRYNFVESSFIKNRILPIIKFVSVLKGTSDELRLLSKYMNLQKSIPVIVETRGSKGVKLIIQKKEFVEAASPIKEIQDTGAGDTFSGSMLFDFSRHNICSIHDLYNLTDIKIKKILKNATCVAALTVQGFSVDYLNHNRKKLLDK